MFTIIKMLSATAAATALVGAVVITQPTAPVSASEQTSPSVVRTSVPARSTVAATVSSDDGILERGESGPKVRDLQRRLVKADLLKSDSVTGFFGPKTEAAVKAFQRRAGITVTGKVGPVTWGKLVKATRNHAPSKPRPRLAKDCRTAERALCADKRTDKLYFVEQGTIRKTMDARFGCAATRTREGSFRVTWKSRNHVSTLFHTPMPYAMFFSRGQAVHYSADFAARGYAGCSHGCVNIRDRAGIAWLFDQIEVGDRVVVYRS